jgi:protein-tyrosine-phosphatase
MAVRVMAEEHGIDLSAKGSKHLSAFEGQPFDWVISLCDRVREVCPDFEGDPETVHWSVADPSAGPTEGKAGYRAFRQLAAELDLRVGFLLAAIAEGAEATRARRSA